MISFAKPVYAQVNIRSLFESPIDSIGGIFTSLLPNLYILAGIIFFLLIFAGGFTIISSAGKGMEEGVAKGQKALTAGVIGFIIVIGSYWIIQIIGMITGLDILNTSL
ncbi:hypothetical protein MUP65_00250 [Patescibacteria group bacterium]|nr:hypothetical protein [Patescibacteria group bacterium]